MVTTKKCCLTLFNSLLKKIERIQKTELHIFPTRICKVIKEDQVTVLPNLNSDHEEADTKLAALVCAEIVPSKESIMVRSPSGDTDILNVFVAHDVKDTKVFIDNGTGKSRKIIGVTSSQLSAEETKAPIGVHAFSENDCVFVSTEG